MTPELMIPLLFAVGIALLLAEILLPTHGIVGALGVCAIVGGIIVAFQVNQWLGAGLMIGTLIATPFVVTAVLRVYPNTPVGRRMLLPNRESKIELPLVQLGDIGRTVTELRPAGACQFEAGEFEVFSEGAMMIHANTPVKVVGVESGRIVVRVIS